MCVPDFVIISGSNARGGGGGGGGEGSSLRVIGDF